MSGVGSGGPATPADFLELTLTAEVRAARRRRAQPLLEGLQVMVHAASVRARPHGRS